MSSRLKHLVGPPRASEAVGTVVKASFMHFIAAFLHAMAATLLSRGPELTRVCERFASFAPCGVPTYTQTKSCWPTTYILMHLTYTGVDH